MSGQFSLKALHDLIKERFEIRWESGKEFANRNILATIGWGNHPEIIGYMNMIRPFIIQVIGLKEVEFLNKLSESELKQHLYSVLSDNTQLVIVADNCSINQSLKQACEEKHTAIFRCKTPTEQIITDLRYRLSTLFTEKITMHGVFMEVNSLGVLIKGESSIGKSELALELINRGHRLIADDAPEFSRLTPDIVAGRCPELLQDLLEVRGLGILNIREMYGDNAIKNTKYLRLMINLFKETTEADEQPRLQSNIKTHKVLDVETPEISIRVAPGRNLAVMVEAAVQNYLISLRGPDANTTFIERQQNLLNKKTI